MTDYDNILDDAPDQHDPPANMPGDMFPLLFPSENWALTFIALAFIGFFACMYLVINTTVFIIYTYWP